MGFETVIFDLDGTLTDSGLGITNSVAYVMRRYGLEVLERKELERFVGPPLIKSFQEFLGFTREKAVEAIGVYREYFAEKGIFENKVYPGVADMLERLKKAKRTLVVATSKPEPFARRIAEHFGLSQYIDFLGGALMDETRTSKADVIAYSLKTLGATDASRAVMVGDRYLDMEGARANGMKSVAVLYGYGSKEELASAGPDFFAETPDDVVKIVLR